MSISRQHSFLVNQTQTATKRKKFKIFSTKLSRSVNGLSCQLTLATKSESTSLDNYRKMHPLEPSQTAPMLPHNTWSQPNSVLRIQACSLECFVFVSRHASTGMSQPNQFIYPHVLKSCPEVLELSGTKMVHAQIVKSGFVQYPVVQTAIVSSYQVTRD
ncbi:hypothetical protein Dsin_003948 [Dipteronia sinensis]|uniref:Uncharacterized protein n=1 Tax=Dipteronia sinensis TaxID=43782 RepID=A0AAE0B918_9ROSI|nr:hypothetical protein Dsin_003948 [Dipteronia sinensis]